MAAPDFEATGKPRPVAPLWFLQAARTVPAGILGQYLLAGLGLFHDGLFWAWHGGLGMLLLLPIIAIAGAAWLWIAVRPLRWWTGFLRCSTSCRSS